MTDRTYEEAVREKVAAAMPRLKAAWQAVVDLYEDAGSPHGPASQETVVRWMRDNLTDEQLQ